MGKHICWTKRHEELFFNDNEKEAFAMSFGFKILKYF